MAFLYCVNSFENHSHNDTIWLYRCQGALFSEHRRALAGGQAVIERLAQRSLAWVIKEVEPKLIWGVGEADAGLGVGEAEGAAGAVGAVGPAVAAERCRS